VSVRYALGESCGVDARIVEKIGELPRSPRSLRPNRPHSQHCCASEHSGLEALQLQRLESTEHFRAAPSPKQFMPPVGCWRPRHDRILRDPQSDVASLHEGSRCTRAWSYSAQLLTRYFVLYLGWTLDFMPAAWPIRPIRRERLGAGSPQARESCTNAPRMNKENRQRRESLPQRLRGDPYSLCTWSCSRTRSLTWIPTT